MKHPLTVNIEKVTKKAILEFGFYSLADKGPHEVINSSEIASWIQEYNKLTPEQMEQVKDELNKTKAGAIVFSYLFEDLD